MMLLTLALLTLPAKGLAADVPQKDDVLELTATAAPVRSGTPDALFSDLAPQIGWIRKGEVVRVLDSRQNLTVFGTDVWLEVQKLDDSAVHGWVLAGTSTRKAAFVIVRKAGEEKAPADPKVAAAAAAAREADALVEDLN